MRGEENSWSVHYEQASARRRARGWHRRHGEEPRRRWSQNFVVSIVLIGVGAVTAVLVGFLAR